MPSCISPAGKDQCLFVSYQGEMTRIEIMMAQSIANETLSVKRWNRLVVNIARLQSTLTTLELIDLASNQSTDLPSNTRIALVVRPDQVVRAKLVESIARNKGMLLTSFFDAKEAATWVKEIKPLVANQELATRQSRQ
jgi:hypothetical protein